MLLAGGVILVAALYGITVLSKSSPSATTVQPAVQNTSTNPDDYLPEDSELANQSRDILAAAANETDDSRVIDLRSQLVALYADNGRLDLAGREMGLVAERLNTADSWAQAGNLHFDWMEQQSGNERLQASKRASVAYEKSLTLDPENLDVRTDLGVAYLNDPASPMPAIRETNAVLEADSNHVQANFNKGVMLLQIGRNADAIRLFEKVKSLTDPESAAYERANVILDQIRSEGG
ncbi:tetratricopeptide repeat protein [Bacteroidota bacterium]